MREEFRLWRTALVERSSVVPAAAETTPPPEPTIEQAPPVAALADPPAANEHGNGRRRRWPAVIFVGTLIVAVSVAGYREFNTRQISVNRLSATRPPAASPPTQPSPPDRTTPPEENDRRRAELADNISHAGEVLAQSGDAAGALRFYRQSLSMRRELAARHPSDDTMLQALAGGWDKVADAFALQGDTTRALGAYREAETSWERCARSRPGDRDVQRNRSLTALALGNLLLARNDPAGAVEAFRRGTSAQETLCRQEPDNAAWQEDLALGWLRLSDAFDQRGDDVAALGACRRALAIDEALVARDSTNLVWQGDLATAHGKAGDLLLACNEVDTALEEYTLAASRREELASADANPERRRAVAEMKDRIGQTLEVKKKPAAALPYYQQASKIIANLTAESPADQSFGILDAAVSFHLGRAMANCRPVDLQSARASLREARGKLTNLKSADGTYPDKEQVEMLMNIEQLLAGLDK